MPRTKGSKNKTRSVKETGVTPRVLKTRTETSLVEFSRSQVEKLATNAAKVLSGYDKNMTFEAEEVTFDKNGAMTVSITNPKGHAAKEVKVENTPIQSNPPESK